MTKLIQLRARLTDEEWRELQKLAIDRGQYVSQMVGEILRKELEEEKGNAHYR